MGMQNTKSQDFGVIYISNNLNSKVLAEVVRFNLKEFRNYQSNFQSCLNILSHVSSLENSQVLKIMVEKNHLMDEITKLLKFISEDSDSIDKPSGAKIVFILNNILVQGLVKGSNLTINVIKSIVALL